MIRALALAAVLLAAAGAQAQQFTPEQQAAATLGQQNGLLHLEYARLLAQFAAAQARIKELEAKAPAPPKE